MPQSKFHARVTKGSCSVFRPIWEKMLASVSNHASLCLVWVMHAWIYSYSGGGGSWSGEDGDLRSDLILPLFAVETSLTLCEKD